MAKAGRPKKGSAGLPEWFDIEKYRPVHEFGAIEWFEQLSYRHRLFSVCEGCRKNGDKDFTPLDRAFNLIQQDPIITFQRIYQTWEKVRISSEEKNPNQSKVGNIEAFQIMSDPVIGHHFGPIQNTGVTLLTTGNLTDIEPKNYGTSGTIGKLIFHEDGTYEFNEPPLKWYDNLVVAVDPTISNEALVREFKDILVDIRKTYKKPNLPFIKNSDFVKWHLSGVLPYLDLLLWEKMEHSYTASAFVRQLDQILDKPISSENAVMKTAQSYAKKLLTPETLHALEAQAAKERRYGSKKSRKFLVR